MSGQQVVPAIVIIVIVIIKAVSKLFQPGNLHPLAEWDRRVPCGVWGRGRYGGGGTGVHHSLVSWLLQQCDQITTAISYIPGFRLR